MKKPAPVIPLEASFPRTYESIATLTIKRAADMTPSGRREVADWLRMHAKSLLKDGTKYSRRFSGRIEVPR